MYEMKERVTLKPVVCASISFFHCMIATVGLSTFLSVDMSDTRG